MADTVKNSSRNTENEEFSVSLTDIWAMFWDYIWWYVLALVVCIFVAGVHLYRTPNTYSRSAKVIVSQDGQDATMMNLMEFSGLASPRMGSSFFANNEVEAFSSHDLMEQVVSRLSLETSYTELQFLRDVEMYKNNPIEVKFSEEAPKNHFSFVVQKTSDSTFVLKKFNVLGESIKSTVNGVVGSPVETPVGEVTVIPTNYFENWSRDIRVSWSNIKSVAKRYNGALSVSVPETRATVIVLSMSDRFPSRAESILNSLIDVYNEQWIYDRNKAARNTSEFIEGRLVVVEKELSGIEVAIKDYKEQNRLTNLQAVSQIYLNESSEYASKSFEVNNQLAIAKFIKEYLDDPATIASLIPANSGIANTNVQSQIDEYNKLLLKRNYIANNSSDKNPLVADLNLSLESLRSAIQRSVDNLISTLELQVSKIESQENAILARIAASSGQELQLLSIQRQQKVKESLYMYLLQKREENEIAALVNVGNTRRIVSPTGPSAPVSPKRMMILLLAIIAGLGIPFAVIFLRKMLDTTVKSRADLSKLTAPFLAEIPQKKSKGKRSFTLWDKRKFDDHNRAILVRSGKRDMMNEAFRVLRTNLDLMLEKDSSSDVIMLTSMNPNSGKTFLSINIAASMAIKGDKTVILDLDMRKASLSSAIADRTEGIASYLSGRITNLSGVVVDVADNLSVIPVGSVPPNPTELLLSDRFVKLIEELKKEYRYVFLDCPPIDIVADSSIISQYADLVLFVVRAGLFDRRALLNVDDFYTSGKFKRMALILNGVDVGGGHYGYGKYGYGRYGYGRYGYGHYGNYGYGSEK